MRDPQLTQGLLESSVGLQALTLIALVEAVTVNLSPADGDRVMRWIEEKMQRRGLIE